MIYIAPTSGKSGRAFVEGQKGDVETDWKPLDLKWRLDAASDMQSRTEVVSCSNSCVRNMKALEPKLRLWHGTDSDKVSEQRTDHVRLWCCKKEVSKVQWRTRFISKGNVVPARWKAARTQGNCVPIARVFKNALLAALRTNFRPKMHYVAGFCISALFRRW